MEWSGVKTLATARPAQIGHGPDQVHGDLPGGHGVPDPLLAPDDRFLQAVILGDVLQNGFRRGDVLIAAAQHVLNGPGDGLLVGVVAQQVLVGQDLIDGASSCRTLAVTFWAM